MTILTNRIADSKWGFRIFVGSVLAFLIGTPIFFGLRFNWSAAWGWTQIELVITGTAAVACALGVGIPAGVAWLSARYRHRAVTARDIEIGVIALMTLTLAILCMVGLCLWAASA